MTEQDYFWGWVTYIGAACVFYAVFWYWIRNFLWAEVRQLIRIILAVILAVPWFTDSGVANSATTDAHISYLSPAWLVSMADMLLDGPSAFWRAGKPLVIALVISVVLSSCYSIFKWRKHKVLATESAKNHANQSEAS